MGKQCPICHDICGNYCGFYSTPEFEVTEQEQERALIFIESIERLVKNWGGIVHLEELRLRLIDDNDLWWLSDAEYRIYP